MVPPRTSRTATSPGAAASSCALLPFRPSPEALARYAAALDGPDDGTALERLVRLMAAQAGVAGGFWVVRHRPAAAALFLTSSTDDQLAALSAQVDAVAATCRRLLFIDHERAQDDCRTLARALREHLGDDLPDCRFAPIPRGGLLVLGTLAYLLELEPGQLEPGAPGDSVPLVLVDDCALTGARFRSILHRYPERRIVFAHLRSHPDLRQAMIDAEPRLEAVVVARDLCDHGPEALGEGYDGWRRRWRDRLDTPRYWSGVPDFVCFPWNEPDRFVWDPVREQPVVAWKLLPPDLCLKNRLPAGEPPVQVQPPGPGPFRSADPVLFAEHEGAVLVADLGSGTTVKLEDTAADMWRALLAFGDLDRAHGFLAERYEVPAGELRRDLEQFVGTLVERGLLTSAPVR